MAIRRFKNAEAREELDMAVSQMEVAAFRTSASSAAPIMHMTAQV
jgi:hypothetical protein